MEVLYIYVCVCVHGSGVREFSLFIFLCIFFSSLFRGPMERKRDKAGDLYDIIVVI